MLRTDDLDYPLPESSIATTPAEPRDAARLLVLRRGDPGFLAHAHVRDLPQFLSRGDVLVVNTTRVIPARLLGVREDTGGRVEGLFLGKGDEGEDRPPAWAGAEASNAAGETWRVMLKGRRMKPGVVVALHAAEIVPSGVRLHLLARVAGEGEEGAWVVRVEGARPGESAVDLLERLGSTPLPPYIRAARKRHEERVDQPVDPSRYQTVYARADQAGSVAAPTAGLHLTPELLARLAAGGVSRADVTLHVGAGTFKPVETEFVEQHAMHAEWCRVEAGAGAAITGALAAGGRVIAVGTTSARTLESFTPEQLASGTASAGWTRLLITPGFRWRNVDAMMTNFHLPRTTLMAMIASLLDESSGGAGDGVARLKAAYAEAVQSGYRFYSYGDAMLILP